MHPEGIFSSVRGRSQVESSLFQRRTWVWKDGSKGYEALLRSLKHEDRISLIEQVPPQPVSVHAHLQVLAADFVGPFPTMPYGMRHILVIVCYFSRYSWAIPTEGTTSADALKGFDLWVSNMGTRPLAFYLNLRSGFASAETVERMKSLEIALVHGSSGSHASVGRSTEYSRWC